MPIKPRKTRSCSRSSSTASCVNVSLGNRRNATPSVRKASFASPSFARANRVAPLRRQRPPLLADLLLSAAREQYVRSALRESEQHLFALRVGVHGAHELPLGGERHLADALEACVEHFRFHSSLARGDDQGSFRRIALHRPAPIAFLENGVVGAVGRGERAVDLGAQRAIDLAAVRPPHGADRRIADALEVDAAARGDERPYGHLVPRQRARLVRRDHARRSQRLYGGQVPHDRVAARHSLHPEREHRRDHGR